MTLFTDEDFGRVLRAAREREGLTQAELARKMRVSVETIGKWEPAQSRPWIDDIGKVFELADRLAAPEVIYANRYARAELAELERVRLEEWKEEAEPLPF